MQAVVVGAMVEIVLMVVVGEFVTVAVVEEGVDPVFVVVVVGEGVDPVFVVVLSPVPVVEVVLSTHVLSH